MKRATIDTWITYLLIGVANIFFGVRLYNLIKRQAVNILFFDQWDFLTPLFGNPTLWEMFTRQHGPHRQGLGLFVSQAVGIATHWNTRAECFGIGIVLVLVTIGAFFLQWRLFGKLTVWGVVIPAMTFTVMQLESVVLTPNPAHGVLPIFCIIISGLTLTFENIYVRYCGLVFVTFLTTYTGFGFFLGLITPIILIFSFFIHRLNKERLSMFISAVALFISFMSLASFFIDYSFNSVQDCFEMPYENIINYLYFVSLELATFLGFHSMKHVVTAKILGFSLFIALISIAFRQVLHLWQKNQYDSKNIVIFLLISFSLLFALNAASGRLCMGLEAAQSSRYMNLLIPGWLGIYLAVQNLSRKYWLITANVVLIILFIILPISGSKEFTKGMNNFSKVKKTWASCYIKLESIEECNKMAGNVIYPLPEATHMQEKLDFLKEKKYNLFSER